MESVKRCQTRGLFYYTHREVLGGVEFRFDLREQGVADVYCETEDAPQEFWEALMVTVDHHGCVVDIEIFRNLRIRRGGSLVYRLPWRLLLRSRNGRRRVGTDRLIIILGVAQVVLLLGPLLA